MRSPAVAQIRPQNDTWIAACCLRYQVPLVTLNTAHFGDVAERHGLVLLGDPGSERSAFLEAIAAGKVERRLATFKG